MYTQARQVSLAISNSNVRYTIATLVTDRDQYNALLQSFEQGGFGADDCEFIYIDNSKSNAVCAYQGLNQLLDQARGDYVILCHQDVFLLSDGREVLDERLEQLTRHDPNWAVAGNAGGVAPSKLALRITDGHGANYQVGEYPERVQTLDENFLVVRRAARVGFSNDLTGFHLYGADICIAADVMGYTAYVIDFHLHHLSKGKKSDDFDACEARLRDKYRNAFRDRILQTTCTLLFVSSSRIGHVSGGWIGPLGWRWIKRLPGARGWTPDRAEPIGSCMAPAGSDGAGQ